MKKIIMFLLFSILAIALLAGAAIVFAQERPADVQGRHGGPGGRGVGGEVTSIDGSTIHVKDPHGEAAIVTNDSTEFVVNGAAGSLADIKVGMFVHAQGEKSDDDTFTATRVFASDEQPQPPGGRGVGGKVTSIDGSTIQVETPHGEAAIVTNDSTEFVVNGADGSLADIAVGMFVGAQGEKNDDGTFTATRVFASDEQPQRPERGDRGVGGKVTSIDGSTIHVETPHGEAAIVTNDSTEFVVNGADGSLADIAVGMFVHAQGEKNDDGTFTATRVFASDEQPQPPDGGHGQRPERGDCPQGQ